MFISKVTLKKGPELFNLLKQKTGNDSYTAHQLLWNLFPNEGDKKRDFLFHKDERNGMPQFLMVSKTEPVEAPGLSVVTKTYSPQLTKGQKLSFTLVANPVVSRKVEGKERSLKHDVWMDAKKQAQDKNIDGMALVKACEDASKKWLIRQGEQHGFSIVENNIAIDGYLQNRMYKRGKKDSIRYSSIHYEGILTVTDPDEFAAMLGEGLGKSKAFGCGLMLVRRTL